jgi:hypothetical protein
MIFGIVRMEIYWKEYNNTKNLALSQEMCLSLKKIGFGCKIVVK